MSARTEAALRETRGRRLVYLGRNGLHVAGPDHDPCFMPVGHGRLCMLPGTHSGGCLPAPVTYPPTVTVAVAS